MTTKKLTKLLALCLPYILLGLVATNFGEAWRLSEGKELGDKIMSMMNAICDTTAKSETLSVKGCKVKITYAPADTDCLDAIQKLLQTTILRTAGHTAA